MMAIPTPNPTVDTAGLLGEPAGGLRRGLQPVASAFSAELDAASDKQRQAWESADQLIASAFILPVLQEVRNSPFKTEMFSGGRGEEVFGQQLDVILAERITQSAGFGLSEALVRQFEGSTTTSRSQPEVDLRG